MAKEKNFELPRTKAEWKKHLTQSVIQTGVMIVTKFLWVLGAKGAYIKVDEDGGGMGMFPDHKGLSEEIIKMIDDGNKNIQQKD